MIFRKKLCYTYVTVIKLLGVNIESTVYFKSEKKFCTPLNQGDLYQIFCERSTNHK